MGKNVWHFYHLIPFRSIFKTQIPLKMRKLFSIKFVSIHEIHKFKFNAKKAF